MSIPAEGLLHSQRESYIAIKAFQPFKLIKMSSAALKIIANLESQIAELKVALGAEPSSKPKNAKKEKDPNAAPKEPNVWIKFTQRVSALLKEASIDTGAAPVSKQFASALKDQKPYADWTDADIVAAWSTWEKPAESKMEAKRKLSESGSVTSTEKPVTKTPVAEKPVAVAEKPVAVAEKPVAVAVAEPAAKKQPKQTKKTTYTLEQLQDFGELEHEGGEYGVNARGDVVDGDGNYVGYWNGKTIEKKDKKPADWSKVMPGSE